MHTDVWYDLVLRELSGDDVARARRDEAWALQIPVREDEPSAEPQAA